MRRLLILILLLCAAIAYAQGFRDGERGSRNRGAAPPQGVEDATWENDPKFKKDVFTFVRLRYSEGDYGGGRRWRGRGGGWRTDHPDSDNNFSFRLQQLTSLK